jgi:hypothetical protein
MRQKMRMTKNINKFVHDPQKLLRCAACSASTELWRAAAAALVAVGFVIARHDSPSVKTIKRLSG